MFLYKERNSLLLRTNFVVKLSTTVFTGASNFSCVHGRKTLATNLHVSIKGDMYSRNSYQKLPQNRMQLYLVQVFGTRHFQTDGHVHRCKVLIQAL